MHTRIHFIGGESVVVAHDPDDVRDKLASDPAPLTAQRGGQVYVRPDNVTYWEEAKERRTGAGGSVRSGGRRPDTDR